MENIFSDVIYSQFTTEFTKILQCLRPSVTAAGYVQLGAYPPIVLLNTLLFFCCEDFGFTTVEQHRQLSFTQLTCCTRTNLNHTRTTSLRFYRPYPRLKLRQTEFPLQTVIKITWRIPWR
ncbi:zinc finger MYM-type protein 4-like [Hippoglossus stenolepis]|uniref:zinc finger MYM-type protein 4-like n=1 Tax=Hippoglossus stenolepis TaxID=195615 RepID=UPI001FAFCF19|nr:zinc finger MYM-type protein 4-like [Hippoglossus stenolepis]